MQTIPNVIYKRAAAICDRFPTVDFLTLAEILNVYSEQYLITISEDPESENIAFPENKNEEETPNLFDLDSSKRRGRCRARFVVVEGTKFGGRDLKQLLREIGIDLDIHYRKFKNAINRCNGNITGEAMAFANVLKVHFGMKVNQFSAYDFDGKFVTVNLTNDGENAE